MFGDLSGNEKFVLKKIGLQIQFDVRCLVSQLPRDPSKINIKCNTFFLLNLKLCFFFVLFTLQDQFKSRSYRIEFKNLQSSEAPFRKIHVYRGPASNSLSYTTYSQWYGKHVVFSRYPLKRKIEKKSILITIFNYTRQ